MTSPHHTDFISTIKATGYVLAKSNTGAVKNDQPSLMLYLPAILLTHENAKGASWIKQKFYQLFFSAPSAASFGSKTSLTPLRLATPHPANILLATAQSDHLQVPGPQPTHVTGAWKQAQRRAGFNCSCKWEERITCRFVMSRLLCECS